MTMLHVLIIAPILTVLVQSRQLGGLSCPLPSIPRHGHVRLLTTDNNTDIAVPAGQQLRTEYGAGESVEYYCDPGYDLHGVKTKTCSVADNGWNSTGPTKCFQILCPSIDTLENGQVFGRSYSLGDTVSFECNSSNFTMYGSPNRTCLDTWRWTGITATCDDGSWDCPDPGIPAGSIKTGSRYSVGDTVQYECEQGNTLRGADERECLTNGSWSGLEPVCVSLLAYDTPEDAAQGLKLAMEQQKYYQSRLEDSQGPFWWLLGQGLDLYFVFDASGSIRLEQFEKSVLFVMKLVEEVGMGSWTSGTRIGIVSVTRTATAELFPHDSTVTNVTGVLNVLREVTRRKRGGTCIVCGLREVRTDMIPISKQVLRHRANVKTAIVLLTDGRYNEGGDPSREADKLKLKEPLGYDANIFTIGIGTHVDREVLESMASEPKHQHVYMLKDYVGVDALVQLLTTGNVDYSACGIAREPQGLEPRIVGGTSSPEGKWRWQAGIFFGSGHHTLAEKVRHRYSLECGGSLIAKDWVLTAAYCFAGLIPPRIDPQKVYIKLGIADLSKEEQLLDQRQNVDVDWVYVHAGFDRRTFEHDIALLHLKDPAFLGPFVGTVCLPDMKGLDLEEGFEMFSGRGTVAGWGTTEPRQVDDLQRSQMSGQLREVELPIQDSAVCTENDGETLQFGTFCAGGGVPENGFIPDACPGDGGGAFSRKVRVSRMTTETRWFQLGIVSWGRGCAQHDSYGRFVNVTLYTDWIRSSQRLYKEQTAGG